MNPSTQPFDVQSWHYCYRQASGEEVNLNMMREHMWFNFLQYMKQNRPDFTQDDLKAVIILRKRRQKERAHDFQSIKFDKIVGCPDHVEQDISEARGKRRIEPTTPRQSILRATGRPEHKEQPAKSAAEIMAERNLLSSMLAEWRENNL